MGGGGIDESHLTLSELICPSLKVALRLSSFLLLTLLYTSLKQQKQKEPVRIVLGGRSARFVSQPGEPCCKVNNRECDTDGVSKVDTLPRLVSCSVPV